MLKYENILSAGLAVTRRAVSLATYCGATLKLKESKSLRAGAAETEIVQRCADPQAIATVFWL